MNRIGPDSNLLLLDGATGTELERRGVDISPPLWSARALLDAPEALEQVHRDYLLAGADAITTCTFRTHARSLRKAGLGDHARELTHRAVEIARAARDEVNSGGLVLGSVAPLEDCYRPDLAPDETTAAAEHARMIRDLVEAGVDFILIETMNSIAESRGAIDAARAHAHDRWFISFCTRSEGEPGVLLSGEPLEALFDELHDVVAIGVNCVAAPAVEAQVRFLRERLPERVRIMAYANIGHADDAGNWVCTDAVDPHRYAARAQRWLDAGATIIGGCCGTTPATIAALKRVHRQHAHRSRA